MKLKSNQSGLSLIELMIASLLGMIILWFMADIYANVTRSSRELARTNSQIEIAATIGAIIIFVIARSSLGEVFKDRAGPFMTRMIDGFQKDAFQYLLLRVKGLV